MAGWFAAACNAVAERFGYCLVPVYQSKLKQPIPAGAKLYVGCGDQVLEGYIGCDLRALEHVHLACRAWEVSQYCSNLGEIYSRHMLEHLTLAEAQLTLQDWYQALAPGGLVRIEVPNMEFALKQWQRATWSEETLDQRYSDARWGFANLFGWQRECDPQSPDYNQSYWDVHKSGYTGESMRYFLGRAVFQSIDIQFAGFTAAQNRRRQVSAEASCNCHLVATAHKPALQQRMVA